MNKKGQAATLILLIMILIVFYIIFLPESERIKILEDNTTSISSTLTSTSPINLLSSDVGTLSYVKEKEIEHTLPSILIEDRSTADLISQAAPFTVQTGWFSSKSKQIAFSIEKPEATQNVLLNFNVAKKNGNLKIKLNDVEIFDASVKVGAIQVISLKKELLQKINTIEFEAYGGFIFASVYEITDFKIIGDVVDITRKFASLPFIISPEEKANLASGHVSFYAVCNRDLAGALTINLNGKVLSSAVPNCNSINRIETVASDFNEERNTVEFNMPTGKARLDSVVVKTKLKPTKSYIDYFNINSTLTKKISSRQSKIWIKLDFVDDAIQKTADLNINGVLQTIDQKTSHYEKDITSKVREGNNYLAITPRTELNVVGLKVTLE